MSRTKWGPYPWGTFEGQTSLVWEDFENFIGFQSFASLQGRFCPVTLHIGGRGFDGWPRERTAYRTWSFPRTSCQRCVLLLREQLTRSRWSTLLHQTVTSSTGLATSCRLSTGSHICSPNLRKLWRKVCKDDNFLCHACLCNIVECACVPTIAQKNYHTPVLLVELGAEDTRVLFRRFAHAKKILNFPLYRTFRFGC